jgi:hypothetical protein
MISTIHFGAVYRKNLVTTQEGKVTLEAHLTGNDYDTVRLWTREKTADYGRFIASPKWPYFQFVTRAQTYRALPDPEYVNNLSIVIHNSPISFKEKYFLLQGLIRSFASQKQPAQKKKRERNPYVAPLNRKGVKLFLDIIDKMPSSFQVKHQALETLVTHHIQ